MLAAVAAPEQAAAQAAAQGTIPAATQPAKPAESLGRIFFTPVQRATLDIARKQRARTAIATEKAEEVTAAPVPQTITYDGMVRRSDGKTTVWVNGRAIYDREPVGGATVVGRVLPDGGVTLQMPQTGRSVDLKPGQSIELLSGAIEEGYSRKAIVTKPETGPAAGPAAEAKGAGPAQSEAAKAAERDREDRDRQRVQDAVSQALQESAGAKSGAAPAPSGPPAK